MDVYDKVAAVLWDIRTDAQGIIDAHDKIVHAMNYAAPQVSNAKARQILNESIELAREILFELEKTAQDI